MTTPFPLYDEIKTFLEKTEKKEATEVLDKKKLALEIDNLPEYHYEYIYALILHYYHLQGTVKKLPPFDAKIANNVQKKGLQFFMLSLPEPLQEMLNYYVTLVKN